jgi:hypothetical protein
MDDPVCFRNVVRRKAALFGVFSHHRSIGRDVDTVDLVLGDIALDSLNLWTQVPQNAAGLL